MYSQDQRSFYDQLLEVSILPTNEEFSKLISEHIRTNAGCCNWIMEEAIKNKDVKIIKFLLEFGVGICELNDMKQTAIHLAAHLGFLDIVDHLFSFSNNDLNPIDNGGLSHFHVACMVGNVEVVKHFLQIGVDVNLCCRTSTTHGLGQFSPLHLAVQNVQLEISEILLMNGANPNAIDSSGMTSLHWICPGISKRMKSLIKRQDFLFNECVLDAFLEPHDELSILKLLIKSEGETEMKDVSGNTPLLRIFQGDYIDQINTMFHPYICDVGLKWKVINEIKKRQGEKLEFLLRSGADVSACNNSGNTALHLAINDMKFSRMPKALPDICLNDNFDVDIIKILLRYESDVNIQNHDNNTPLQLAVSILSFDVVELLLEHGANVTSIHFDPKGEESFQYYMNVAPCLKATENLIRIFELLQSKGFQIGEETIIVILKFLVKSNQSHWSLYLNDENFLFKLKNLIELGAELDVLEGLESIAFSTKNSDFYEQSIVDQMLLQMEEHLLVFELGGFYLTEKIKNCIESRISSYKARLSRFLCFQRNLRPKCTESLAQELTMMKVTMLDKTTSLHDILQMDLHETFSYLKSGSYQSILDSEYFHRNFIVCGGIIRGHLAKSLVRRYVTRSALGFLKTMTSIKLPDLCCERICSYLSNQSLVQLCVAVSRAHPLKKRRRNE